MTAMKNTSQEHGAYVRKVQEDTQNFAQGLLGEIERLRVVVATLEAEARALGAAAVLRKPQSLPDLAHLALTVMEGRRG